MNATQKRNRIERAENHEKLDRLAAGNYIVDREQHRGCSVGCDLIDIELNAGVDLEDINDGDCHAKVASHDGTAPWIEHLRDVIFEGLPQGKRSWWHVELAKALPVTDTWKPYRHRICKAFLLNTLENKACWQEPYAGIVDAALLQVITYHDDPTEEKRAAAESAAWSAWSAAWSAWSAVESAARSAAESAAESAARSAAESAVESAARSAACSARSAAWSARSAAWSACSAESAARSACSAESAAYERMAQQVIDVFLDH